MNWLYKKRTLSFLAMLLFVVTGTYNAIVITSESHLNGADMRFVKRLDEMKGIIEPGRLVATGIQWQKLEPALTTSKDALGPSVVQQINTVSSSPSVSNNVLAQEAPAAVTEELNLNLIEVINPKKWQNGVPADQFSGNLTTSNGSIDSLNVTLPNSEGLTVSFSEMNGNVFEYDIGGEVYSGMLYQVDQTTYMVTLTNGPLEGTRLRFVGEPSQEQVAATEEVVTGNTETDQFGNSGEQPEQTVQAEEAQPAPAVMVNMQPEQALASPYGTQDVDNYFQNQGLEPSQQESNNG